MPIALTLLTIDALHGLLHLLHLLGSAASSVSCTTDCSAHWLRPKAGGLAGSLRKRLLISTSPWAPANIAMKASESLSIGVCLTVFCAMRTCLRIGSNRSSCLSFTPSAARLAHGEKCRVVCVLDSSIVMVLLSLGSLPSIGMTHHPSFGKSLSVGSMPPLLWAKFR